MGSRARSQRAVVATLALVVAGVGLGVVASPASADTAPTDGLPTTVAADALPTWQVNGVVWSQVVVGNTVYVTGSFTQARPPGVAVGGAGSISANNIFAYNVTTGNPVGSFNHSLNAQGLVIRSSPDGSRVYVGGDFTTVDGTARSHVAAFNTATGALDNSFAPSVGSQVAAIAVSPTTVYVGGNFQSAGGQTRHRLAAFNSTNGAMLSWTPSADDYKVTAMVLTPDRSKVIVGGSFTKLSGQSANGMGALDATTGAVLPWQINTVVTDGGNQCGILSLSADDHQVYGSGFAFGCGNFEGTFAANPDNGAVNWVNDCHGDTYDTYPVGQALYSVSHAHNCSFIGDFNNSNPWSINMRHALAFSTYPTGMNSGVDDYGWNYTNVPDSSLLQWFPVVTIGSYTGQNQAAWSVAANANYVVLGGEFPSVNGTAQQGLVRFAVSSIAPNKRGPVKAPGAPAPTAQSFTGGQARVAWQSAYDMDNKTLTYNVYRSGTAAPVYTTTQNSTYWNYPMMGFIDKGLPAGASYTYTIKASDAFGNLLTVGTSNSVTITAGSQSQYAADVVNDGAVDFWRLGEPSGTTVYDHAGFNDAISQGGVTRGATGAILGDTDKASTFDGASDGFAVTSSTQPATPNFTVESWIKTTTNQGGKIVGYGNANSGTSSNYDRHLYMDNAGHIIFGVYNNATYTITSPKTYNDGVFHQIVGTLDSSAGMTLYIDGKKIGVNQGTTVGQPYTGYWRIGGDNLNGWPNQPGSHFFNGTIDDVALYPSALSLAKVQLHFTDSGRTLGIPTPPADTYGKAVYNSNPDLYWRLGDTSGTTAKDTSPNGDDGVITGGVTLNQPGGITGTTDKAMAFNGSDGTIGSANQQAGPSVYSEELWFKTTTTHGGKLIGFGNAQSGNSSAYDRHVYMENSGQLTFGTWTGFTNTATSPLSYNDGAWHYMVAKQGPDGMHLYVDGAEVASNPQSSQQPYDGYWRVGGDSDWGGDSPYLNGTIDEVAVYGYELTQATITAHYQAGGGTVTNQNPQASFTDSESGLKLSVDGSASSDPDGMIASYDWNWGDGSAHGSGVSPNHTYGATGDYTVTLTVTDDQGGTGTLSRSIHVTNAAPSAAFTSSTNGLVASVDGSGSSDPDGTIASYDWNWGDGSAHGSGVSPSHTYAAAASYTVTLTVTDNAGGTNSVQHTVTVANATPTLIASDDFGRTTTNGWGTADQGGAWTVSGNTANFKVGSGVGTISVPTAGAGPSASLKSVSTSNADVRVMFSPQQIPTGGGSFFSVLGRQVTGAGYYSASFNLKANGSLTAALFRVDGGGQATIAAPTTVPGLTVAAGDKLDIRLVVSGTSPTTLMAKIWRDGTAEPSTWQVTGSDTAAAMQAAGSIGLTYYLSGTATAVPVVANVDTLRLYDSTTTANAIMQAQLQALAATPLAHKSRQPTNAQRVSTPFVIRRTPG